MASVEGKRSVKMKFRIITELTKDKSQSGKINNNWDREKIETLISCKLTQSSLWSDVVLDLKTSVWWVG